MPVGGRHKTGYQTDFINLLQFPGFSRLNGGTSPNSISKWLPLDLFSIWSNNYNRYIKTYLCIFSAVESKLILLGIAPVESVFGGGGLTRLSVTFSEFTSWLELRSETEVSTLFTDKVLKDMLLFPGLFLSILDELMLTILVLISDLTIREVILLTRLLVEMVALDIRDMRSVIADRSSRLSQSIPESNRSRSYWETERALRDELSLEFSDRSMRSLSGS